jgi:hypothetical protein
MAVGRWGLFRVVTPAEHLPLMRTCLKQRAVLRQIRGVDRRQHQAPSMTSRRARTCRKRTTTRSKSPAQWPKTSRARPALEVQTLIHPISIPVTNTSVNSARSTSHPKHRRRMPRNPVPRQSRRVQPRRACRRQPRPPVPAPPPRQRPKPMTETRSTFSTRLSLGTGSWPSKNGSPPSRPSCSS